MLNDPAVLRECIPGCESLEGSPGEGFSARVTTKVGPVKATFNGAVTLSNVNPPESYTISGEGKGGVAGFAKGGADVHLRRGRRRHGADLRRQCAGRRQARAARLAADRFHRQEARRPVLRLLRRSKAGAPAVAAACGRHRRASRSARRDGVPIVERAGRRAERAARCRAATVASRRRACTMSRRSRTRSRRRSRRSRRRLPRRADRLGAAGDPGAAFRLCHRNVRRLAPPRTSEGEDSMSNVTITVNGRSVSREVEDRTLLVQFLRDHLGLTGTHVGCDTSQCGACVVHMDGVAVKSCTVLAAAADGSDGAHHRGPRQGRPAASGAGGLPRASRPAMRLLHAGHDHDARST